MPPHLLAGDADVADITDILIDTGYSKEELEKIVSLGDMISFDAPLKNSVVTGFAVRHWMTVAALQLFCMHFLSWMQKPCLAA